MSATIIIFPVGPRIDAAGADEVTLHVRLPRRVFNRLQRTTAHWDIGATAAAEVLLSRAINDAAGVKSP